MPQVHIPTAMRQFTKNEAMIHGPSGSIRDLFAALEARTPGLHAYLYDQNGQLKSYIAVFVNDTDIYSLQAEQTHIGENDTVYIIPAIAGGCMPEVMR